MRSRIVTVAVASILSSVATGATAFASPTETTDAASQEVPLTAGPTAGARGAAADPSPSDCWGYSHRPHKSHHNPDRVNAEARTTCDNNVPRIHAHAQLWEDRWWGFDRVGNTGDTTKNNKRKVSAFANWECRNNTFRLTGSHEVVDVDGETYTASTESDHVSISC